MDTCPWLQATITFPDWNTAEHTAAAHLAPLLTAAEADQMITAWFFVRKAPAWRLRYLPHDPAPDAHAHIHRQLENLRRAGLITNVVEAVYEPETHAFGGVDAMTTAHQLWHLDSRHVLSYLATTGAQPDRRRELSVLLYSAMLRAARLDWYEQGDVWARVAQHRDPPDSTDEGTIRALEPALRRLMSVQTSRLTEADAPLAPVSNWTAAFIAAGNDLAALAEDGTLHRGLRAVLAHHIIFAYNRLGIPATSQAILAATAKSVVFGHEPTIDPGDQHDKPTSHLTGNQR